LFHEKDERYKYDLSDNMVPPKVKASAVEEDSVFVTHNEVLIPVIHINVPHPCQGS